MPFLSCHFPSNTKYSVLIFYVRGGQPVRDQEPQRATSYIWTHMNTTPSLPQSNTFLSSARFIVNITHQHGNDRTFQAIYCYACYLVGLLVITYCKSRMKSGKEPHVGHPRSML